MSEALPPPCRLLRHEAALLTLGAGTTLALAARAGLQNPITSAVALATAALGAAVLALGGDGRPLAQKARLAAAYGFVLCFYLAVRYIVPALDVPLRDDELRAADEAVFGCLPALALQAFITPWLTDLLSACYAGYLVYLHVVLVHAMVRPVREAVALAVPLGLAFAVGLAGYLLVPAVCPGVAFPGLFTVPLEGGRITDLNAALVANGSPGYDTFPSLHVLVTCLLLDHDRRFVPCRFRLVLLPAAGMLLATLYLRFHYAVDLAAGFALFLFIRRAGTPPDGPAAIRPDRPGPCSPPLASPQGRKDFAGASGVSVPQA